MQLRASHSLWRKLTGRRVIKLGSPSSWPSPSGRRNSFVAFEDCSRISDSIQRWDISRSAQQNGGLVYISAFFNWIVPTKRERSFRTGLPGGRARLSCDRSPEASRDSLCELNRGWGWIWKFEAAGLRRRIEAPLFEDLTSIPMPARCFPGQQGHGAFGDLHRERF